MFDIMVKMKNKKGFTLVEMLVVIAIIAILVSIVIPVVGNSVQKSHAATNAANLRSIEGKLSTLRVEQPLAFETAVQTLGNELSTALKEAVGSDNAIVNRFIDTTVDGVVEVLETWGLSSYIDSGDSALSDLVEYHVYHRTAENGTLQIHSITLENVPTAKAVSVPGMEVAEGTQMTVYLTETSIRATYESGDSAYTCDDFADVAETGEFTGTASGGLSGEGAANAAGCEMGYHSYVSISASEHKCEHCSETGEHDFGWNDRKDACNDCGAYKCMIGVVEHELDGTVCDYCGTTWCGIEGNDHSFNSYNVCVYCETVGEGGHTCSFDATTNVCGYCGAEGEGGHNHYNTDNDCLCEFENCNEVADTTKCIDTTNDKNCDNCGRSGVEHTHAVNANNTCLCGAVYTAKSCAKHDAAGYKNCSCGHYHYSISGAKACSDCANTYYWVEPST